VTLADSKSHDSRAGTTAELRNTGDNYIANRNKHESALYNTSFHRFLTSLVLLFGKHCRCARADDPLQHRQQVRSLRTYVANLSSGICTEWLIEHILHAQSRAKKH